MMTKMAYIQENGTATENTVSSPQLMSMPSRQSQYQRTALTNGVMHQPMMPAMKAKSSVTHQKSIDAVYTRLPELGQLPLGLCSS